MVDPTFLFDLFSSSAFAEKIKVASEIPIGRGKLWGKIIPGVIQLLLFIGFILTLIYLLLGGISWITSGGNKEAVEGAKKKITYAIVGLILVLLSFAILYAFGDLFGVSLQGS